MTADVGISIELTGLDQVNKQLASIGTEFTGFRDRLKAIGDSFTKVGQQLSIGVTAPVVAAGAAILKADAEIRKIESSLKVATGSIQGAAKEFDFLRDISDRLGLNLTSAGQAFGSLAVAAKGTALEGQATRDIFEAVASAMTALGRSSDDTSGALLAIEQIVSKGTVSMEELRQQLGERLPGAFQAAANAMGVTTEELDALVSSGSVTAEQLLPALAAELDRTFGSAAVAQANTFGAEMARLSTAFAELGNALADVGIADFAAEMARFATEIIENLKTVDVEVLQFSATFAGIFATAGPIALAIGGFIALVGAIPAAVIAALSAVVAAAVTWQDEIGAAFTQAGEVVTTFVDGFSSLPDRIIGAVGDLGRQLGDFIADSFQDAFGFAGEIVEDAGGLIANLWRGMFGELTSTTEQGNQQIVDEFTGLSDELVGNSIIPDMVDDIVVEYRRMAQESGDLVEGMAEQQKGIFESLAEGLSGAFDRYFERVTDLAAVFGRTFDGMFRDFSAGLRDFLQTGEISLDGFKDYMAGLFADITASIIEREIAIWIETMISGTAQGTSIFAGFGQSIGTLFGQAMSGIGTLFTNLFGGTGAGGGLWNTVLTGAQSIFSGFGTQITSLFNGTTATMGTTWAGFFANPWVLGIGAGVAAFAVFGDDILKIFSQALEAMASLFRGFIDLIVSGLNTIVSAFSSAFSAIGSAFSSLVGTMSSGFQAIGNIAGSVASGIGNAFTSVFNSVGSAASSLASSIGSSFSSVVSAGNSAINALRSAASSIGSTIRNIPGIGGIGGSSNDDFRQDLTGSGQVVNVQNSNPGQNAIREVEQVSGILANFLRTNPADLDGRIRIRQDNDTGNLRIDVPGAGRFNSTQDAINALSRFNFGGSVPGLNLGFDSVPAILTPGEFVVRSSAADRFSETLRAINDNRTDREVAATLQAGGASRVANFNFGGATIIGDEFSRRRFVRELARDFDRLAR